MKHAVAVPFTLKRSKDEFGGGSITSTTETVHGLLRLEGDQLVIQWRLGRHTEEYGVGYTTDEKLEAVREEVVPLSAVSGAYVRRSWWDFWRGPRLVLNAADLRAFDGIVGAEGLRLSHPAEMVVGLRRADLMLAEEFTAELTLALAELVAGEREALPEASPPTSLPDTPPPHG